tara:strand:+ start:619 stop:1161 length:543 start_codon:yes stop_codon:yes gene_type:complete
MDLPTATAAYLAAHRPQAIDVDIICANYRSLENYLFIEGAHYDRDHPWLRYIEISQWDQIDGYTQVIEWEDDVQILLPWDQSGLEDWLCADDNLTPEQADEYRAEFYERVTELILEECEHAEINIAYPGDLTQGEVRTCDHAGDWVDWDCGGGGFLEHVLEKALQEMEQIGTTCRKEISR